jgi:hypothetical protein
MQRYTGMINADSFHLQDDIYFCPLCAEFFHARTDRQVRVEYWELPYEFAIALMEHRAKLKRIPSCLHRPKRARYRLPEGKVFF